MADSRYLFVAQHVGSEVPSQMARVCSLPSPATSCDFHPTVPSLLLGARVKVDDLQQSLPLHVEHGRRQEMCRGCSVVCIGPLRACGTVPPPSKVVAEGLLAFAPIFACPGKIVTIPACIGQGAGAHAAVGAVGRGTACGSCPATAESFLFRRSCDRLDQLVDEFCLM